MDGGTWVGRRKGSGWREGVGRRQGRVDRRKEYKWAKEGKECRGGKSAVEVMERDAEKLHEQMMEGGKNKKPHNVAYTISTQLIMFQTCDSCLVLGI